MLAPEFRGPINPPQGSKIEYSHRSNLPLARKLVMRPISKFLFTISVPDGAPEKATALQGFAPSLCEHFILLQSLVMMPSDIEELAIDDRDLFLARRMSGGGPINWMPSSPNAIRRNRFDAAIPFGMVIVSPADNAADYADWKAAQASPPLIIAEAGGDLSFDEFSLEKMFAHFIGACDRFEMEWGKETADAIRAILRKPNSFPPRDLGYKLGGHNAFSPNLAALAVAGFADTVDGRFNRQHEGDAGFIEGIVKTATSIFDERERVGLRELHRAYPLRPDLMLFAPSMYTHLRDAGVFRGLAYADARKLEKGLQILLGQKGYAFTLTPRDLAAAGIEIKDKSVTPNPLISERQREWFLNTALADLVAASEFSVVVRLPNEINRTAGQVRLFAAQHRSNEVKERKRVKAFRDIQTRLKDAIPPEILELIRRSQSGVRIVSDAPLEWLDLDGVPLGIARDTARIPTTPGNTFVELMRPYPILRLRPEAFREILIVNAVKKTDPIYPAFEIAMDQYERALAGKVALKRVDVSTRQEFVTALNDYQGAFMIFNGHGSHERDDAGKLWLKDEPVDVWSLRDEVRTVPAVVLLSACDTHAADRNHATAALGFLGLGAVTVLGTFLPLPALDASIFAARLIMRVVEFIPAAIRDFGRAITWSEVAGGMLRMTLLTDFLRRLLRTGLISEALYHEIHLAGNGWINSDTPDPFRHILKAVTDKGIPENQALSEFRAAIATSTAISYVQMGRPETLLFDTVNRIEKHGKILVDRMAEEEA